MPLHSQKIIIIDGIHGIHELLWRWRGSIGLQEPSFTIWNDPDGPESIRKNVRHLCIVSVPEAFVDVVRNTVNECFGFLPAKCYEMDRGGNR